MRYYVKERVNKVDYTTDDFQPCWTCRKACGGCSWSRNFTPIPGWEAQESFIPANGEYAKTYKIISCPQYVNDRKR